MKKSLSEKAGAHQTSDRRHHQRRRFMTCYMRTAAAAAIDARCELSRTKTEYRRSRVLAIAERGIRFDGTGIRLKKRDQCTAKTFEVH